MKNKGAWPRWRRERTRFRELRHPGLIKSTVTPVRCLLGAPAHWGVSGDDGRVEEGVRRLTADEQSRRHWAFWPRLARAVRGEERGDDSLAVRPSRRESPGRPGGAIGGAGSDLADRVREWSSAEAWGPRIGTPLAGFAYGPRVAIAGLGAGGGALI
ncbi:hypothetical protein NDU88_006347 [Pleurodeles waltl]|uniref:Uncharacterized protein n=1 Tax=Pleurodeles waltl TaxID=8319 RepID=A0AAV7SPI0_PLEWA|nr:hypothetical protein NDU88_006347 [Pleurodeles waltl]